MTPPTSSPDRPHRSPWTPVLTAAGALAVLAVAALPSLPAMPAWAAPFEHQPSLLVVSADVAVGRVVSGEVTGPLGQPRDGVLVEARSLTGVPASSAITYGGAYELRLPAGTYVVTFTDGPGADYDVAPDRLRVVVGATDVVLPPVQLLFEGPQVLEEPRLEGRPVVGRTLRADPGVWDLDDARIDYTWFRDDRTLPVDGATYELQPADAGHRILVRVTASLPLHQPGAASTDAVRVTRAECEVAASAARAVVRPRGRVVIEGRVAAARGGRGGAVQVFEGTRPSTRPVTVARDGSFRVEVPVDGRGRHTYLVRFTGNRWTAPSWSDVVRVTAR